MPGFSEDSARRIAEAVRAHERGANHRPPRARGPVGGGAYSAKVFLVTNPIQPIVGMSPGAGLGTEMKFDPAARTFNSTPRTNVPIYNMTTATIALNALVQCVLLDGYWFYDVTDCSNGS